MDDINNLLSDNFSQSGKKCGWDLKTALLNQSPSIEPDIHVNPRLNSQKHEITYKQIQECHKVAAQIVKEYGEDYLPIFERLHQEVKNHERKSRLLNTAFEIAKKNNT